MNNQKGLAPILIVLLITLAIGGYLIYQKQPKPVSQPSPSPMAFSSAETTTWKTYTNKDYKYEIKYPNDWTYKNIQYQNNGSGDTAPSFTGIGLLPIEPKPADGKYATILIRAFDNPKKLSL